MPKTLSTDLRQLAPASSGEFLRQLDRDGLRQAQTLLQKKAARPIDAPFAAIGFLHSERMPKLLQGDRIWTKLIAGRSRRPGRIS